MIRIVLVLLGRVGTSGYLMIRCMQAPIKVSYCEITKRTEMMKRILTMFICVLSLCNQTSGQDEKEFRKQVNIGVTSTFLLIDLEQPINRNWQIFNLTFKSDWKNRKDVNFRIGSAFNFSRGSSPYGRNFVWQSQSFIGIERRSRKSERFRFLVFADLVYAFDYYRGSNALVGFSQNSFLRYQRIGLGVGLGVEFRVLKRLSVGTETALNGGYAYYEESLWGSGTQSGGHLDVSSHRFLSLTVNYHF